MWMHCIVRIIKYDICVITIICFLWSIQKFAVADAHIPSEPQLRKVFRNRRQCNHSIAATERHITDFKRWVPRWHLCSVVPQKGMWEMSILSKPQSKTCDRNHGSSWFESIYQLWCASKGSGVPSIPEPLEDLNRCSAPHKELRPIQASTDGSSVLRLGDCSSNLYRII